METTNKKKPVFKCRLGGNVPSGGLPCLLCNNFKMLSLPNMDGSHVSGCDYLIEGDLSDFPSEKPVSVLVKKLQLFFFGTMFSVIWLLFLLNLTDSSITVFKECDTFAFIMTLSVYVLLFLLLGFVMFYVFNLMVKDYHGHTR